MKAFKKLAAVVLAAAVVLTMLAGCKGGTVPLDPEQEILKKINEVRAQQNTGLAPVEKDPTLSKAASALLEAFAKHPVETAPGDGYKLTEDEAKQILMDVTGRNKNIFNTNSGSSSFVEGSDSFWLSPLYLDYKSGSGKYDYYLLRRLDNDFGDNYSYNYFYGYNGYGYSVVSMKNLKVGIAIREIKGERFIMVVYETSKVAAP